jgi:DNA-binding CsgD family transcriptional regulator
MEFKKEELIEREIEIAQCLLQGYTFSQICTKTGISKKHVVAHVRNMITKLKVKDIESLLRLLKSQHKNI